MRIAMLRHAPTEWNAEKRIQGHTDVPLSAAGRTALRGRQVPSDLSSAAWFASPLIRAAETAARLGLDAVPDPRLKEMAFGAWEGHRLVDLRAADPAGVEAREGLGLDFRAPGGESPAEVAGRLTAFATEKAAQGLPLVGAVTHKGVLRAALALATGWDMREKAPVRLDWAAVHVFDVSRAGTFAILDVNRPLVDTAEALP